MSAIRAVVLGSGSAGNCTALAHDEGTVLVDCGFSPRETRRRMAACGLDPARVTDILLTHPDGDHLHPGWTRALGGLAGPRLHVARRHAPLVRYAGVQAAAIVEHEEHFEAGGVVVASLRVPHDSLGSCALRIERAGTRIAYATDLGRPSAALVEHLAGCPFVFLESNYCPRMQRASGRPPHLIERIMGGRGHLSNEEALGVAQALDGIASIERLVLLHLSRQCNAPERVRALYAEQAPSLLPRLLVTTQTAPSDAVTTRAGGHATALF